MAVRSAFWLLALQTRSCEGKEVKSQAYVALPQIPVPLRSMAESDCIFLMQSDF